MLRRRWARPGLTAGLVLLLWLLTTLAPQPTTSSKVRRRISNNIDPQDLVPSTPSSAYYNPFHAEVMAAEAAATANGAQAHDARARVHAAGPSPALSSQWKGATKMVSRRTPLEPLRCGGRTFLHSARASLQHNFTNPLRRCVRGRAASSS